LKIFDGLFENGAIISESTWWFEAVIDSQLLVCDIRVRQIGNRALDQFEVIYN
jgi:hypothetical protein